MQNSDGDYIGLGPRAQLLSPAARQLLLNQYTSKAQNGQLYSDPASADWGAVMRLRGIIEHPSVGKPVAGQSPTIDDLMFRVVPSVKPATNDQVLSVPPGGHYDPMARMQYTSAKVTRAKPGSLGVHSRPSFWAGALGVAKRVAKGAINDVPVIAGGLAAAPAVVGRLAGDAGGMVGDAVVGSGEEFITHNYKGSQKHAKAVRRSERDAANVIGTVFGAGPKGGLLTDLATDAGYYAGGQKGMAGAKLKQIGQNIVTYSEDHPLQQTLNILAISGVARAAALGEASRIENVAVKTGDAALAQKLLARAYNIRKLVAQADHITSGGKVGQAIRDAAGKGAARVVKPILDNPVAKAAIKNGKPLIERSAQRAQKINNFGKPTVIHRVRGGGLASSVPDAYIDHKHVIDMAPAPPKGGRTAKGYPRNKNYFWRKTLRKHPEMFSPVNAKRVLAGKRAPTVDDQWIEHNPSHRGYKGHTLVHHHHDQGRWASALPKRVHQAYTKILHPTRRLRVRRR